MLDGLKELKKETADSCEALGQKFIDSLTKKPTMMDMMGDELGGMIQETP